MNEKPVSSMIMDEMGTFGSKLLASFNKLTAASPVALLSVPRLHTFKPDSSTQSTPFTCSLDTLKVKKKSNAYFSSNIFLFILPKFRTIT